MRKSTIISFFVAVLLLTGCASQNFKKVKKMKTAAIPIVNVNSNIDYSNVQDGAMLEQGSKVEVAAQVAGAVQQAADDDFEFFQSIANDLRDRAYNDFSKKLRVQVVDEDKVINSAAYQDLRFDLDEYDLVEPVTPDGYKPYQLQTTALIGDDRNQRMFEVMPDGTDAMIYVSSKYAFVDVTSFFGDFIPFYPKSAALESTVRLTMFDSQLNEILDVSKTAKSSESVVMAGTATLQPSKLEPMANDATKKAMDKLSGYLESNM